MADYPSPKDAKQLKQFLSLSNYYRRFVKEYAALAEPLLRGKPSSFTWDTNCQQAFEALKTRLVSPPILALPNFSEPFILYTDASSIAIGGILGQLQNGGERVVAYWSRQLKSAERNYSTIERESLAAVSAIKEFYPYLYGRSFTLVTDHNPLTSLKNLHDFGGRLTRWSLFLQQFNFTFMYKRGSAHTNADCLSRIPVSPLPAVDEDTLRAAQQDDPQLQSTISALMENKKPSTAIIGLRRCFLQDGVLCRQYMCSSTRISHIQIIIPTSLRDTVLDHLHNSL